MNIFYITVTVLAIIEAISRLSGAIDGRVLAVIWLIAGIILALVTFGLIRA